MQPQPPPPTADDYLDLSFKAIVEQSITGIYVIQDIFFDESDIAFDYFYLSLQMFDRFFTENKRIKNPYPVPFF